MGLGRIDVQAGDFKKGLESQYVHGKFLMKNEGAFFRETILPSQIEHLELATEESVISIGGAAGWGIAGKCSLRPSRIACGSHFRRQRQGCYLYLQVQRWPKVSWDSISQCLQRASKSIYGGLILKVT